MRVLRLPHEASFVHCISACDTHSSVRVCFRVSRTSRCGFCPRLSRLRAHVRRTCVLIQATSKISIALTSFASGGWGGGSVALASPSRRGPSAAEVCCHVQSQRRAPFFARRAVSPPHQGQWRKRRVARRVTSTSTRGVNWCNTLELWRKVLEAQPFVDERWQIYGFEASPLIMPFAERAVPRRSRPAGPCRRRPCGLL